MRFLRQDFLVIRNLIWCTCKISMLVAHFWRGLLALIIDFDKFVNTFYEFQLIKSSMNKHLPVN